jgi:hypothetical protein
MLWKQACLLRKTISCGLQYFAGPRAFAAPQTVHKSMGPLVEGFATALQ